MIKPIDGFSGIDVWLVRADDPSARSLVDSATDRGRRQALLQEYLPAVAGGNKRLFVLDGEIIGAVDRVPSAEDFRIGPPSVAPEPDRATGRSSPRSHPTCSATASRSPGST